MEESRCGLCGMRHRIVIITTPLGLDDVDEPEICVDCATRWDRREACEDLVRNESASARTRGGQLLDGRRARGHSLRRARAQKRFRVWVTLRAASKAEAHSRTAGPR